MHKIKTMVRVVFALTTLFILSIIVGSIIGSELSYKVTPEYTYSPISYTQTTISDSNYPKDKSYFIGGEDGSDITTVKNLVLGDIKIELQRNLKHTDPVNKHTFQGTLSNDGLKAGLQSKLNSITTDLKTSDSTDKYDNLNIENLNITVENQVKMISEYWDLGSVDVFMQNCNFYNTVKLKYNLLKKDYEFTDLTEFESRLCNKYITPDSPLTTACTDCTYYPVDKKHPLDANYSIEVIAADGIPGGQSFSKSAYEHLLSLYTAAKAAGHNMRLTSAYRSYQDQQEVYEGWVQYEMGFGKSRAQAESDANSYSALPGFSEHQLGTTADMSSLDCIGIETVCASNERFWDWLKDNAYKYGFVMSYPMAKDDKTGYIHEPWHYRFISVELATEFREKYESRSYLAEFLRNKKLY